MKLKFFSINLKIVTQYYFLIEYFLPLFTGVLLVQAFYQISCRHIEDQQPEDSVSNEKIQHQLQDLLLPLFQPNDKDNVGNVLNIIPYTDRKRSNSKKNAPMTIILTTNLSKKRKTKGKKDVVIALQTLNSYGAPLPDIESLLNLNNHNTTQLVKNLESVPSTNEETSELLENDEAVHNISEDENTENTPVIQNRNAKSRHHHAKNKKEKDDQNLRRKYQKPQHIEINLVRAVHPSTAEQLSTEEQLRTGKLTTELSRIGRKASSSNQSGSAERQLVTAEQSSTAEEPLEATNEADESIELSNSGEKTIATEEPIMVEEHNVSEQVSTIEQPSTEEQLRTTKHQSSAKQQSTAELQTSSEQLSTAEQSSTMEKSNTAEQLSTMPNSVEQRSTTMKPGIAERLSTREERSTAEHSNTVEQSSSSELTSTAEQADNMKHAHAMEESSTAELGNITEQIDRVLKEQAAEKYLRQDISAPWLEMLSEEPMDEKLATSEVTSKLITKHHSGADITTIRGQIHSRTGTTEEPITEKFVKSELTLKDTSDVPSEDNADQSSTEEITSTIHTATMEKKPRTSNLVNVEESTVKKPIVSEVIQNHHNPNKGGIVLEQYVLENEPDVDNNSNEVLENPIKPEITPKQLGETNDNTLHDEYHLEHKPKIDKNIQEEPSTEIMINHKGGNLEDSSGERSTSELTIIRKIYKRGKKKIHRPVEKSTEETLASSEATLERLGLINADTLAQNILKNKPVIAETTEMESGYGMIQDHTENELEVTSEEAYWPVLTHARKNYKKGKQNLQKPNSVIAEERSAEITPEHLGLINGDFELDQYPLIGEELKEEMIPNNTGENLENNYEEVIPNISLLRDYDAYNYPVAEPAVLPDAETSNLLNILLRQTEINSLLTAQNNGQNLDSETQPLVVVVPGNLDKSIDCPDKENKLYNDDKRLRDKDIMERLNWDSNEIPLDVRDNLGQEILNEDLLNPKYILKNINKNNALLRQASDLRPDNLDMIIPTYNSDEILRDSFGDDGDGNHGVDGGGDLYPEQEEHIDNQEVSKQIVRERLANNNNKLRKDKKELKRSYNLAFIFNRK